MKIFRKTKAFLKNAIYEVWEAERPTFYVLICWTLALILTVFLLYFIEGRTEVIDSSDVPTSNVVPDMVGGKIAMRAINLLLIILISVSISMIVSFFRKFNASDSVRKTINDYLRDGVFTIQNGMDHSDLKDLIVETPDDEEFLYFRTFALSSFSLPIDELADAVINRGVVVKMIVPSMKNAWVRSRERELLEFQTDLDTIPEADDLEFVSAVNMFYRHKIRSIYSKIEDAMKVRSVKGKLMVLEYDGQFCFNMYGSKVRMALAPLWVHRYAASGPHVVTLNQGHVRRDALQHFERIWDRRFSDCKTVEIGGGMLHDGDKKKPEPGVSFHKPWTRYLEKGQVSAEASQEPTKES